MTCRPECRVHCERQPVPAEPAVGTWVKDRFGGVHVRIIDADGNNGWAASPTGFYAFGKWEAMWEARGPLEECGAWGLPLDPASRQLCPDCLHEVVWDATHQPFAWRHVDNDSRWCTSVGDSEPAYPRGATDRNRVGGVNNPELWRD